MLLAHSAAVKIYRTKYQVRLCSVLNICALKFNNKRYVSWMNQMLENKLQGEQKGSIGIALVVNWMVPYSNSLLDQQATQRAIDFRIGWFVHTFCLPSHNKIRIEIRWNQSVLTHRLDGTNKAQRSVRFSQCMFLISTNNSKLNFGMRNTGQLLELQISTFWIPTNSFKSNFGLRNVEIFNGEMWYLSLLYWVKASCYGWLEL